MKCPKCGGNAELSNWGSLFDPDYADFHVQCEKCGYHSMGSTDPQKAKEMFKKEMGMYYTNEQWIHHMNTEQLAEWIAKIVDCDCCPVKRKFCDDNPCKIRFVEWLKQPRKE